MAKKVSIQKSHSCRLEAPRNRLELPVETSQSYFALGDYIPYSYEGRHEWFDPTDTSMKKLINEEMSKGPNTKPPSVVARLMGMDTLPLYGKSGAQKAEKPETNFPIKEWNKKGSGGHIQYNSNPSKKIEFNSFQYNKDSSSIHQCAGMKLKRPKPREHPQEEELQKFKKEFVAWQAARFRECSKVFEVGIPSQWLAQGMFNKEKIALYENSSRITASEKPIEVEDHAVKALLPEGGGLLDHTYRKELFASEQKELYSSSSRTLSRDFQQSCLINFGQNLDVSSAPTKIVILRPSPEHVNNEESSVSLSGISDQSSSVENFLEEIKEKLNSELQGKPKRGTIVGGGEIEAPYSQNLSYSKQIAQRMANRVREGVTRDFGLNLHGSKSTSSYRSEYQYNGAGSLEYIDRDSQRLLAERPTNVLKGETNRCINAATYGSSDSSMLETEEGRSEQSAGELKDEDRLSSWNMVENEPKMQTRHFGHWPDDDGMCHIDLSSGNLVRSLSAPVSGTSFGKLLLEDRNVFTGAHICRKHEALGNAKEDMKKQKKERFNFRGKVSSLKYGFSLRGRLFGRKMQLAAQPCNNDWNSLQDVTSGMALVMNSGEKHENSTEVPPSPASVCSSVHELFWEVTNQFSSTSTPDASPLEDDTVHHVFRETNSNLSELRRQLNELDADGPKEILTEQQSLGAEREIEGAAEAYIRDLLVASGMYTDLSDKVISIWDPTTKLISNRIFEDVEESYRKMTKDSEGSRKDQGERVNHKLLFDLLNEAVSTVLSRPVYISRFGKKVTGFTSQAPHGRKLLDSVWEFTQVHLYPLTDISYDSLDDMIARDLDSSSWPGLMNDDIAALGKDMESRITRDLIEEIVKDW